LLCAQSKHVLTLDESIAIAVKRGFIASEVASRYISARNNAESSRRKLWTSMSLSVSAPDFQESLTQQFNPGTGRYEYYQVNTTNLQSTLSINQPLVLTGGTLRFNQILLGRNQTSGLSSSTQQLKDYFSDFAVEFQQPFLTPNMQRVSATRADLALEQAETDYLKDQLDLGYSVTESFYTVFQATRNLQITREQVRQNQESYLTARNKYSAGLIPEVDVLQSEVELAASRNDSLGGERELLRSKNAFRLLLGIPTEDSVEISGEFASDSVFIDLGLATESALKNRSEVLASARNAELREADVDVAKSRSGFRFDLTARYGLNRNDTLFNDIFTGFNRARSASLVLTVPIFDWGGNSLQVEAAEVDYQNARARQDYVRQQIHQEIIDLVTKIDLAYSRVRLLEKSVTVAQKGYDISLQRFRTGSINRNDLAQTQQRLTAAKTNALNALIDYRLGLADLKRKTLWDFERNERAQPLIEIKG
jgi:outer membrane protein TolC